MLPQTLPASSSARRRFFLIGDVGGPSSFHLGDEAMLQANLERLREMCPGAELTVASRDPEWTSRKYDVRSVPRPDLSDLPGEGAIQRRLDRVVSEAAGESEDGAEPAARRFPRETVGALAEADTLLISGGGNLNDSWPDQLYERVILLALAERLGVAAAVTGQTLGPHLGSDHREVLRPVLAKLSFLGVRERYSVGVARLLGVPRNRLTLHLDDAFFLPSGRGGPSAGTEAPGGEGSRWIAVTVARSAESLEPLAKQLEQISRETGCRLVFVPHVKEPDGDVEVARALVELMPPDLDAQVVPVPSVEEGRGLAAGADLVLSMRYHPLVFALAGGVPALGVYVDEYTRVKLRGALQHGGLEDWVLPLDMALSGRLLDAGLDLWRNGAAIRRHLAGRQDEWLRIERTYRLRLGRALGLGDPRDDDPPEEEVVEPAPSAGPGPSLPWGTAARRIEQRADLQLTERLHLLEQVDRAVEYALSLEGTLAEREREIEGLKQALEASRRAAEAAEEAPEARPEDEGGVGSDAAP